MNLLNDDKKGYGKKYPKNPIVKRTFIDSLYDYPDGVDVEIKNISKLMTSKYNADSYSVYINLKIIGEMPECNAYVVDDATGEYVKETNKYGIETEVMQTIDAHNQMVSMHISLDTAPFKDEFMIGKFKSYYNLFRYAMIKAGQMPTDYDNDFTLSYDDLKNNLVGLKCCLGVMKSQIKGIKPYDVFLASDVIGDYGHAVFNDAGIDAENGEYDEINLK